MYMYFQMYSCFKCGVEYRNRSTLIRHVRLKHPKKMLKCNKCPVMVSSGLKYRIHRHQNNVQLKSSEYEEIVLPDKPEKKRSVEVGSKKLPSYNAHNNYVGSVLPYG